MVTKITDKIYKANVLGYDLEIKTNDNNRIVHIIGGSHYLIDDFLHQKITNRDLLTCVINTIKLLTNT